MSLSQRSFSAVKWTGLEGVARQAIQLASSVALARLLSPSEFGLIAMLSLFTALASVFADSGLNSALVQHRNPSPEQMSSVFYFNLAAAGAACGLLCLCSPLIAKLYGFPQLAPLTCVMGANILVGCFGSVHSVVLVRNLDFRAQCQISLTSAVISSVLAVWLASRGFGVWSLAFQTITATAIATLLLWSKSKWKPLAHFRALDVRELFRFGSYLFLSQLLETLYSRIHSLLIGKMYTPRELGLYARADSTQQVPASFITSTVNRVAFPVFSQISGDAEALRRGIKRALEGVMFLNIPAMLGLFAVAGPLVHTFYGPKWEECIPYLRILALGGIMWPMHVINLTVLQAQGRTDLFFRLEVIKKATGIGVIAVALFFGILALAWAAFGLSILFFFVNAYYTGKLLKYSAFDQLRSILPSLIAALLMLLAVSLTTQALDLPAPALLSLQVISGAMSYVAFCYFLKVPSLHEAWQQCKVLCRWFQN